MNGLMFEDMPSPVNCGTKRAQQTFVLLFVLSPLFTAVIGTATNFTLSFGFTIIHHHVLGRRSGKVLGLR